MVSSGISTDFHSQYLAHVETPKEGKTKWAKSTTKEDFSG